MADDISMTMKGMKDIENALHRLGDDAWKKAIPKAIRESGKPLLKATRDNISPGKGAEIGKVSGYDTGILRKSLGVRLKKYPKTGTQFLIIGPRRGFKRQVRETRSTAKEAFRTGKTKKPVFRNPVNYAHLVEDGFYHVKSGRHIQGLHFMRKAYDANAGKVISNFSVVLWGQIDRIRFATTAKKRTVK